jgi:hypothetical protein
MTDRRLENEEAGAILIILMVALTVAAIALGASVQAWSKTWRRDNEEELIFRANQYVDAIIAYRKEHGGQFPLSLQDLYKPGPRRLRYIRRLYREPISKDGRWGLLYLMPGGRNVYDPKAAQKAQEKAAKEWGSGWVSAGSDPQAQQAQASGVTAIGQDQLGSGVPGTEGMPAGSPPPVAIQGNLPPIPSEPEGGLTDGQEPVSEPPIGWPIVGVISRATGKAAADTFKIYKGHDHVDEWQFHVFDRGEQVQVPGNPGVAPRPAGLGPGFGNKYQIQGIGGGDSGGWFGRGPRAGGRTGGNPYPNQGGSKGGQQYPGNYPPTQVPPGSDQENDNP